MEFSFLHVGGAQRQTQFPMDVIPKMVSGQFKHIKEIVLWPVRWLRE